MSRQRKDLKKKIASLSALGAGALVFGAGEAEAGIIYSGVVNAEVGFNSGNYSFSLPNLGASNAFLGFYRYTTGSFSSGSRSVYASGGSVRLGKQSGLLQLFNAGAIWNAVANTGGFAIIGGRSWYRTVTSTGGTSTGSTSTGTSTGTTSLLRPQRVRGGVRRGSVSTPVGVLFGHGPFNNQYALFQFTEGTNTLYGWVQLSYSVFPGTDSSNSFGPDLTIHDWAYDDSGAMISAGNTGQAPEPGTLASTGLAALALGAAGLRQWRKARKAA